MRENEKIADIVAEMRQGMNPNWTAECQYLESDICTLADRIKAAWKREKAEIEANALNVGAIVATTEKSSAVGNAAAMREALELAIEVGDWCCANTDDPLECCEYSCVYQVEPHGEPGVDCPWKKIRAALSAPPRNCDRFRDVNLAYKRFKSYVEKKNPSFTKNSPTHTVWDALKWALMPYEEKEVETK